MGPLEGALMATRFDSGESLVGSWWLLVLTFDLPRLLRLGPANCLAVDHNCLAPSGHDWLHVRLLEPARLGQDNQLGAMELATETILGHASVIARMI